MFDDVKITMVNGHVQLDCIPPDDWDELTTDEQFDILHDYVDGYIKSIQFMQYPGYNGLKD